MLYPQLKAAQEAFYHSTMTKFEPKDI